MNKKAISLFASATFLLTVFLFKPAGAHAAVSNWTDKGISVLPQSSTDFSSQNFHLSMQAAQSTGVNNVTLIVPFCQNGIYTAQIDDCANTPTDQALGEAIDLVHSLGMRVTIKLHDYPNDGSWSAYINPSGADRDAWFANYNSKLRHIAKIAQPKHVEEIVIGNELNSMTESTVNPGNTQNWLNIISGLRKIYSGRLTYGANWGGDQGLPDEKDHIDFWGSLDDIGISAYYNLSNDLQGAWAGILASEIAPLHAKFNKPILFTEIGYKSAGGARYHPWDWTQGGGADVQEQADDYDALFSFWDGVPYMNGASLWQWSTDPAAGGPNNNDYTPQGKTAQQVMERWFKPGSTKKELLSVDLPAAAQPAPKLKSKSKSETKTAKAAINKNRAARAATKRKPVITKPTAPAKISASPKQTVSTNSAHKTAVGTSALQLIKKLFGR